MKRNEIYKKIPSIHKAILLLAIVIMIVSGFLLAQRMIVYKSAQDEYQTLRDDTNDKAEKGDLKEAFDEMHKELQKEEQVSGDSDEEAVPINTNCSDFPEMTIDFDELEKINQDIVAWLYVGAVNLSYPVVQGADNEYYLTHTFENQKNASGCLFMDCEQDSSLSDYNTFIYGHNMKDGSMFGALKKLLYMNDFDQKDPYFYLYTKGAIYQYRLYSCYQDTPDSKSFWKCKTKEEYQQYQNAALKKSSVIAETGETKHLTNADTGYDAGSVVLVTCTGEGVATQRLFVHGQLECIFQDK